MSQEQTSVPQPSRAYARRVPGLEGISARVRVEVEKGRGQTFAIRDGAIEPVKDEGRADATIAFDDESTVKEFLSGKLNPIVAALRGKLRAEGDAILAARVVFEIQGQANAFGQSAAGEA